MANRAFAVFLVVLRLGLAVLFISQLSWKLPPRFGCPAGPDFVFTTTAADGSLRRSTGLCDWIGVEAVWSHRERWFFARDTDHDGIPDTGVSFGPLVRWNGWVVERIVMPNLGVFGWLIAGTEAVLALSLAAGLLSRIGAALALGLSIQLLLGVGNVFDPASGLAEAEWLYWGMIAASLVLVVRPAGRWLGVDAVLRQRCLNTTTSSGWRRRLLVLGS